MGIEDINISEELETNAPSIKYSGNEGPKSPQEMEQMIMASLEEEYLKYVDDMMEQGIEPMTLQQFLDQAMAEGQMSGGQPLPNDPTKPVNPFQPKPTGPVLPDRQMAAYGGIMGVDGRKQYGIGSWFQDLKDKVVDDIIPNEIKDNPELAAAAALVGANYVDIPLPGGGSTKGYIGDLFSKLPDSVKEAPGKVKDFIFDKPSVKNPNFDPSQPPSKTNPYMIEGTSIAGNIGSSLAKNIVPILGGVGAGLFTKNTESNTPGLPSDNTGIQLADLKKGANLATQQQGLAAGLNFLPTVASRKYTPEEMAITYAQAAATGGRIGYNLGGRIGMAEGGIMDLGGMEKDYRAEGGFVPIGREEKADDVPARLSVNEFVFTADAVRNAGGGDIDQGAKVMENMMKHLEQGGQVSEESQGMAGARDMFETSERLSEVI